MYDLTRLHTAMLEQGYTVLGLSVKAKMPEATVRQIFKRGSGHPDNLKRMAKTLGVELKDLLPRTRKSA